MRDDRSWLLLTTSTSGATASLRVTVWRRLRGLGGLYLQSSVCLLPDRPSIREAVDGLRERVLRDGGSMRVLPMQVRDAQTHAGLVAELDTARDLEYAEVLERLPTLIAELALEKERGRSRRWRRARSTWRASSPGSSASLLATTSAPRCGHRSTWR